MAQQYRTALAILRRKQVEARTGLSRSSIYFKVSAGTFPQPVRLGIRTVGWIESEIEAWLLAQIEKSRKV
ncbi:AlpA family transcriptional regulator [Nitrosospira sp. Is2]|uniref:helix-turn-helix transcriptional regulator n=1 Tax=Nitrosospira sp. Is2 TaxID=3080532 RepID=UPI002952E82A|nr:AlpA family transcriptional regulator [Nitrosospira sp. Is2]WON72878.1 AlpA family transcriptional regulator [Nitrosospira sp. Is2]